MIFDGDSTFEWGPGISQGLTFQTGYDLFQGSGMDNFFETHSHQLFCTKVTKFGHLPVSGPKVQILDDGCRHIQLMDELNTLKICFAVIVALFTLHQTLELAVIASTEAHLELMGKNDTL
jgi:hypothetical protein